MKKQIDEKIKAIMKTKNGKKLLDQIDVILEVIYQAEIAELKGATYNREFKHKRLSIKVSLGD